MRFYDFDYKPWASLFRAFTAVSAGSRVNVEATIDRDDKIQNILYLLLNAVSAIERGHIKETRSLLGNAQSLLRDWHADPESAREQPIVSWASFETVMVTTKLLIGMCSLASNLNQTARCFAQAVRPLTGKAFVVFLSDMVTEAGNSLNAHALWHVALINIFGGNRDGADTAIRQFVRALQTCNRADVWRARTAWLLSNRLLLEGDARAAFELFVRISNEARLSSISNLRFCSVNKTRYC